jgi:hypothetical protein
MLVLFWTWQWIMPKHVIILLKNMKESNLCLWAVLNIYTLLAFNNELSISVLASIISKKLTGKFVETNFIGMAYTFPLAVWICEDVTREYLNRSWQHRDWELRMTKEHTWWTELLLRNWTIFFCNLQYNIQVFCSLYLEPTSRFLVRSVTA